VSSPGSLSRLWNQDVIWLSGDSGQSQGCILTVNVVRVILKGLNRREWHRASACSTTVRLGSLVSAEPACACPAAGKGVLGAYPCWAGGCFLPECANCAAASYSVQGTGVNAECGMAHGSSTFEESKSLGSSVDEIGETLRAFDFALDCRPHGP
jgi:hypothetical protein